MLPAAGNRGESGGGGLFTGNEGFASYLPMVVGLLPDYINQIGEKVRKVELTITWENARGEQNLTLVQYVTNVDADEKEITKAEEECVEICPDVPDDEHS